MVVREVSTDIAVVLSEHRVVDRPTDDQWCGTRNAFTERAG
jgi:hypothetical protein